MLEDLSRKIFIPDTSQDVEWWNAGLCSDAEIAHLLGAIGTQENLQRLRKVVGNEHLEDWFWDMMEKKMNLAQDQWMTPFGVLLFTSDQLSGFLKVNGNISVMLSEKLVTNDGNIVPAGSICWIPKNVVKDVMRARNGMYDTFSNGFGIAGALISPDEFFVKRTTIAEERLGNYQKSLILTKDQLFQCIVLQKKHGRTY